MIILFIALFSMIVTLTYPKSLISTVLEVTDPGNHGSSSAIRTELVRIEAGFMPWKAVELAKMVASKAPVYIIIMYF